MNIVAIDTAIMAIANSRWQKIAMLVARVANTVPDAFTEDEDDFELIASGIDALIASGNLLADGDTSDWRRSEVKLP